LIRILYTGKDDESGVDFQKNGSIVMMLADWFFFIA
jgi:hypothetical protein